MLKHIKIIVSYDELERFGVEVNDKNLGVINNKLIKAARNEFTEFQRIQVTCDNYGSICAWDANFLRVSTLEINAYPRLDNVLKSIDWSEIE